MRSNSQHATGKETYFTPHRAILAAAGLRALVSQTSLAGSDPEFDRIRLRLFRLEATTFSGAVADFSAVTGLVRDAIRKRLDNAILARSLCLLSRVEILQGQHERAIVTAEAARRAFEALDTDDLQRYAGPYAEALRAGGCAMLKLGHISEALPLIEAAVNVARSAVDLSCIELRKSAISPLGALVRSSITLGAALSASRQINAAIDVYYRTVALTDAHPAAHHDFPDDVMLAHWSLIGALHDRARSRRAAGEGAASEEDIAAAARALEVAEPLIDISEAHADSSNRSHKRPTLHGRAGYFGAFGRHLLLTGQPAQALAMFERQLAEIRIHGFVHSGNFVSAHIGIADASAALERPQEALRQTTLALEALDGHDDASDRAAALLARASAQQSLGLHAQAYDTLGDHYAIRSRLDLVEANNYASLVITRRSLERARSDADSHERAAAMLVDLSRIGQEITANLQSDEICRLLWRHVDTMIGASRFEIWLLDLPGERLSLGLGVSQTVEIQADPIQMDDRNSILAHVVRAKQELVGQESPASLYLPLTVGERAIGVVVINFGRDASGLENEHSILRVLCTYGAIALDNAAAYRELAYKVEQLVATQTELTTRTAEYERLSMTDQLTGLGNRRHLQERAAIEVAERQRRGSPLAVAMFDIDHFKQVNDTYGHAVGDTVLQSVARIAKYWLRPADFIARVGGEEFALLLPGAGIDEAVGIAERIRTSIAETGVTAGDATISVTSSFGVATFVAPSDTLDHALSRADKALYSAKAAGRNQTRQAEIDSGSREIGQRGATVIRAWNFLARRAIRARSRGGKRSE